MKSRTFLVVTSFAFAAACGGSAEHANNSSPAANHTVSANAAANANIAIPPEFAAAANQAQAGNLAVNGAMKPPTKTEAAPKTFEFPEKDGPAPDDSDIKTVLGENLVQTRTFHSNPEIAKIEKTTVFVNGQPRSSFKVYLKNGQVKDTSLKNALIAPAADVLKSLR